MQLMQNKCNCFWSWFVKRGIFIAKKAAQYYETRFNKRQEHMDFPFSDMKCFWLFLSNFGVSLSNITFFLQSSWRGYEEHLMGNYKLIHLRQIWFTLYTNIHHFYLFLFLFCFYKDYNGKYSLEKNLLTGFKNCLSTVNIVDIVDI